jgi:hypothetical protein
MKYAVGNVRFRSFARGGGSTTVARSSMGRP